MLETDALKEKLEMEIHRFARPPEELSSGDPYFEQLQTMLAIREELENIPLCDIQRDMLLAMENVLESAWLFRNTPVPDRCMNPNNISEVVYYFLRERVCQDDFCKFSKFKYLSAEKSPNISCLHIS